MRGWSISDLDKLSARGMRVSIAPIPKNRVVIGVKKIPSLNRLRDKAQKEFNRYIRLRDENKGCISCSSMEANQAGHYLSAGHNTALRFNEVNTNLQCVRCNMHLSGNSINYRIGLVKKYGEEVVKELENSAAIDRVKKWDRTILEIIYKMYKEKNNHGK